MRPDRREQAVGRATRNTARVRLNRRSTCHGIRVVVLACVGLAGSAAAQAGPTVLVVPGCDEARLHSEVSGRINLELSQLGWTVVELQGVNGESCRSGVAAAIEEVDKGKALFYRLRLKVARVQLEAALTHLGDVPVLGTDIRREALLYLGWIAVEEGNPAAAAAAFRSIHRLWPAWRPSAATLAPAAAEAFERHASTMEAMPQGRLTVESLPAGASITVDGVSRGEAPVQLSLAQGLHHLQVHAGGLELQRWVTVASETHVAVAESELAPPARATLVAQLAAGDRVNLESSLSGLVADRVLVLAVVGELTRVAVHARQTQYAEIPGQDPAKLVHHVVVSIGPPPTGDLMAEPALAVEGTVDDGPAWMSGWLWPAVGAAVVAVSGGIALSFYAWQRRPDRLQVSIIP